MAVGSMTPPPFFVFFSVILTTSGLKCRYTKGLGPIEGARYPTLILTTPS